MTNPPDAAYERKKSMWHEDSAATRASSGSTAAGFDSGTRTTEGELDAGTTVPPSNRHSCAREYRLSLNGASDARVHKTVAVYWCIEPPCGDFTAVKSRRRGWVWGWEEWRGCR